MRPVAKALAAGGLLLVGYFAGFYEMKYKTMKCLLQATIEKKEEESQE